MSETGGKARLRYAVIGAGMSGVMAAIKLLQRGDSDFAVFEKGAELGGTWRDNRYPGLTCDTPSHAYSYSFALNPDWSAYYATGSEIHAYFKGVAERFGTENVAGVIGFAQACQLAMETLDTRHTAVQRLREQLEAGLSQLGATIFAPQAKRLPNTSFLL